MGLIEQDAPVDDSNTNGEDQSDIVEPPVDFKRLGHVLDVVGVIFNGINWMFNILELLDFEFLTYVLRMTVPHSH